MSFFLSLFFFFFFSSLTRERVPLMRKEVISSEPLFFPCECGLAVPLQRPPFDRAPRKTSACGRVLSVKGFKFVRRSALEGSGAVPLAPHLAAAFDVFCESVL